MRDTTPVLHHYAVVTLRQANMRLFVRATVCALNRTWEIEVPPNLVQSLRPTLLTEGGPMLKTMIMVMLEGLAFVPPMITQLMLQEQAVREMEAEAAGIKLAAAEVGCDPAKLKIQWQV
jgi:hypothetical protein